MFVVLGDWPPEKVTIGFAFDDPCLGGVWADAGKCDRVPSHCRCILRKSKRTSLRGLAPQVSEGQRPQGAARIFEQNNDPSDDIDLFSREFVLRDDLKCPFWDAVWS